MNFIFVKFKHEYQDEKNINYYSENDCRHQLAIKRILDLYPEGKVHVITDNPNSISHSVRIQFHYFENLDRNNYAKLHIFGLLDKPAIYLDNDVIVLRRFTEEELPTTEPFNVYQKYPSEIKEHTQYNTGVVWIPRPNKKITYDLLEMREQFDIYKNGWVNDEYPVSYFIHKQNMKMIEMKQVNAYREKTDKLEVMQSIHYTGTKYKPLFLQEFKRLTGATGFTWNPGQSC